MPNTLLRGGIEIEIPNRAENRQDIAEVMQRAERERARGTKWMRLPETLSGVPKSSAITLGVNTGQPALGPDQGYAWSLRRLVVSGLTASASTPDIVNLYRSDRFTGPPLWQFNGNNFGYTFGRLELVLMPGDSLSLQNVGTIAATGTITLSGELVEVPAEMLYKLA